MPSSSMTWSCGVSIFHQYNRQMMDRMSRWLCPNQLPFLTVVWWRQRGHRHRYPSLDLPWTWHCCWGHWVKFLTKPLRAAHTRTSQFVVRCCARVTTVQRSARTAAIVITSRGWTMKSGMVKKRPRQENNRCWQKTAAGKQWTWLVNEKPRDLP